jgi:hypothetical protein
MPELSLEAQNIQLREAVRQLEGLLAVTELRLRTGVEVATDVAEVLSRLQDISELARHRDAVRALARLNRWLDEDASNGRGAAA